MFKFFNNKKNQLQEFLTASDYLTERYEKISTEVNEKTTTFFPILISKFISVPSKKISYFSEEVHPNTPSGIGGRDLGTSEMKSTFEKMKSHRYLWVISVTICLIVILSVVLLISIIICQRRRQRERGEITDTDNTMLALSENLAMEESSVDFSQ